MRISLVIKLLDDLWLPASLPYDKKRLAENIDTLINCVGIDLEDLNKALIKETELGRGTQTLNLSPYATVVQTLLNQETKKMKNYLTQSNRKFKVFIPNEIIPPPTIDFSQIKNVIFAGSGFNLPV
jgi:hypothetical protein